MFERKYGIENNHLINKRTGNPVPDDEPLFIFRAQDQKALCALTAYCAVVDDLEQRQSVAASIEDFRVFQMRNPERIKEPTA